jgi:hypothetical protein
MPFQRPLGPPAARHYLRERRRIGVLPSAAWRLLPRGLDIRLPPDRFFLGFEQLAQARAAFVAKIDLTNPTSRAFIKVAHA